MTTHTLKNELLNQAGTSSSAQTLSGLQGLIAREQRQTRRLVIATASVWLAWFLFIAVALAIPQMQKSAAPHAIATQPVAVPVHVAAPAGNPIVTFVAIVFGVCVWFGLPLAGIFLLILLITTRRSAGWHQIRASIAALELQLQELKAAKPASEERQGA